MKKIWTYLIFTAIVLTVAGGTVLIIDPFDWYHTYEVDEPYTIFSSNIEGVYAYCDNNTWIPDQSSQPNAWDLVSIEITNGYHFFIALKEDWAVWSNTFTFWFNGTAQVFNCTFHESTEDTLFVEEMSTNMLVIEHEDYFTFLCIEIYIIIPFDNSLTVVGETNF